MASEWDRLYEEARRLHQAGGLDEALAIYQKVIAGNPGHGGAMHMLGLIAFQIGRTDTAVDLLRQAAVLDPMVGAVHSNLGLALMARGRGAAAEESFRRALLLSPQAETHASLGSLLLQQGRLEEAAASYRAALARNANLSDAQAGLGETLWKLGRPREAEAAYEQAAKLSPSGENEANLAMLAFMRGYPRGALARITRALAAGETPRGRAVFTAIVTRLRWDRDDPHTRQLLARALEEAWAPPALLLAPAADLVKLRLRAGARLEDDALLQLMLAAAPIPDPGLEAALAGMRRQLLAQPEGRDLAFSAALALQCFLTGYAWPEEKDESAGAEALARRIEAALASDDVVSATELLALACYRPLSALKGAEKLPARGWPDPLEPVLDQQLREAAEEKRLAGELPALMPLTDAAEPGEDPFPRWVRLEAAETPITVAAWLGRRFPGFDAAGLPLLPDMLFAGCGSGQAALELSRRHPAASRLGIDRDRAALAYAARKAAEAGVEIAFAQADILRLPETKRRFTLIECSGVLHLLDDPFAGLAALVACLAPGGVMRLGMESSTARALLAPARAWAAQQGLGAADIRGARAQLLAQQPEAARLLLTAPDFFETGACRALLFPARENAVTLPAIAEALARNGLTLLGLETGEDVLGAYRARFPADPNATDLANWAAFEADYPTLFTAGYRFWVQKP